MKTVCKYIVMLFALAVSFTAWGQTNNRLSLQVPAMELSSTDNVSVMLSNTSEVVGLQCQIVVPSGATLRTDEIALSNRKADHEAIIQLQGSNTYLLLVYSPTSSAFKQNSGALLTIPMSITAPLEANHSYTIELKDVVLSAKNGENVLTSTKNGNLRVVQFVTITAAATSHGHIEGTGKKIAGDEVELTAVADEHYHLAQWEDGSTNPQRVITPTTDMTVSATFAIDQFRITAAVTDAAKGSTTGSGVYDYDSQVTLRATANPGYHFTQWTDGITSAQRTVKVGDADATYTADFAVNQYQLTVNANNDALGTVTGGGTFDFGSTVTVTATATAEHYHFAGWSDGNGDATRQFTIPAGDVTLTALFIPNQYTISVLTSDSEMGTVSGGGTYDYQSEVTLTATAKTGYHFVEWTDGVKTATRNETVGGADATYTATFAPDRFMLNALSANEAHGTVSGSGEYDYNSVVTIKATPAKGYAFAQWSDGNKSAQRNVTIGLGDATYTATFTPIEYKIVYVDCSCQEFMDSYQGTNLPGNYTIESEVTLAEPTRTGYTFAGWYNEENQLIKVIYLCTGDMTLHAEWQLETYTITYDNLHGADNSANPTTYTIEDQITFKNPDERTGYTFAGWKDANGNAVTSIQQSTGNLKLTATWTLNQYTITYNNTLGVTNQNPTTYTYEDEVTFLPCSHDGYNFVEWQDENGQTITGIEEGSVGNRTLTAVWSAKVFTITYKNLLGATNSNPETYTIENTVVLSDAGARRGYTFVGWHDEQDDFIKEIPVGSIGNRTFTAMWMVNTYIITAVSADTEMGTVAGGGKYGFLAKVNLTATANEGYHFVQWTDGVASAERTITVDAEDATYTAQFAANEYTLTVATADAEQGTVTGSGKYLYKSVATVEAIANKGYHFAQWNDGDQNAKREVTIPAKDLTLTASFAPNQYNITVVSDNAEMGTVTGSGKYDYKSNVDIKATANEGYHFVQWTDGVASAERTITVDAEDATYTATFAANEYEIQITLNDETFGSVTIDGSLTFGSEVILTAIAQEGYHFVQWSDGNTEQVRRIIVTGNVNLTAIFEADHATDAEVTHRSEWTVYVVGRSLYVKADDGGEYEVYCSNGSLVYTGNAERTDLPQAGVYIVRKGNETKKVVAK
ncbi:MAG: InlB B-repeat-containing protein [Paludibacteraceae bacterium]|nr:InlB B-repeat-containing protein [Paludibacteraceae bacterium]